MWVSCVQHGLDQYEAIRLQASGWDVLVRWADNLCAFSWHVALGAEWKMHKMVGPRENMEVGTAWGRYRQDCSAAPRSSYAVPSSFYSLDPSILFTVHSALKATCRDLCHEDFWICTQELGDTSQGRSTVPECIHLAHRGKIWHMTLGGACSQLQQVMAPSISPPVSHRGDMRSFG